MPPPPDISSDSSQRLSWRDPSGFLLRVGNRIFRAVARNQVALLEKLLASHWYLEGVSAGRFPASKWLDHGPDAFSDPGQFAWLEHELLQFPCYPHEITSLQLYDAATLTLSVAREALSHDWVLKDASAWNVLFENGRPCFCDLLSFAPNDHSGIWLAYGQFCRHFVIPLLLHRELGFQPSEMFLSHRDGITPEMARPMLRGLTAYLPPALETVTIPARLVRRGHRRILADAQNAPPQRDPRLAKHILTRTITRLEDQIHRLRPAETGRRTRWGDFENNRSHYGAEDLSRKAAFVSEALDDPAIGTVLDLGCNTGEYSRIAASLGKRVVAADHDHGAVTKLYATLRRTPAKISPVLLDLGRPTPAVGWLNKEVPSFVDRARGAFDCVMVLGLMHHLLVAERAPLPMILALMQTLEPKVLIAEWVEPRDPRFREIAGFNRALYTDLSSERFEAIFSSAYRLVRKYTLPMETRTLYLWKTR